MRNQETRQPKKKKKSALGWCARHTRNMRATRLLPYYEERTFLLCLFMFCFSMNSERRTRPASAHGHVESCINLLNDSVPACMVMQTSAESTTIVGLAAPYWYTYKNRHPSDSDGAPCSGFNLFSLVCKNSF